MYPTSSSGKCFLLQNQGVPKTSSNLTLQTERKRGEFSGQRPGRNAPHFERSNNYFATSPKQNGIWFRLLEKGVRGDSKPLSLGSLPSVSAHTPQALLFDHIMNLSIPAIDVHLLPGFFRDSPQAPGTGEFSTWRSARNGCDARENMIASEFAMVCQKFTSAQVSTMIPPRCTSGGTAQPCNTHRMPSTASGMVIRSLRRIHSYSSFVRFSRLASVGPTSLLHESPHLMSERPIVMWSARERNGYLAITRPVRLQ